jgi:ribosomal protein S18 acetylase RimI-like enzyme
LTSLIEKIDPTVHENSEKLYQLFQVSYAVEAKLLKAVVFPPLQRIPADFRSSETDFYAFWKDDSLAGAVELLSTERHLHVQSLVVDPRFFRQGIGKQLMNFVLKSFEATIYMVETGKDNGPASSLYLNLGFTQVDDWMTDIGIRKVRFEMKKTS